MQISKFRFTAQNIAGNEVGSGIATDIRKVYKYVDGNPTDEIIGYKIGSIFPDAGYEKEYVKVPLDGCSFTNEDIANNGGKLPVQFKGLSGKFYTSQRGLAISVFADSVSIIGGK